MSKSQITIFYTSFLIALIFIGCSKEEEPEPVSKTSWRVCHSFESQCDSGGNLSLQVGGRNSMGKLMYVSLGYRDDSLVTGIDSSVFDYFEYSESTDSVEFCVEFPDVDTTYFTRHCGTAPIQNLYRQWVYVKGVLVKDTSIIVE